MPSTGNCSKTGCGLHDPVMTFEACADLVERGDPDRFLSAMTARQEDRGALMAIYAFNLEVARAPWVTKEAMIAEMRLQWWADTIEEIYNGKAPRQHEVVTPLAEVIQSRNVDRKAFDALIEARRFDVYAETHADAEALDRYIMATAGGLMWLSAQALGAGQEDEFGTSRAGISVYGYGVGVASLLRAYPALKNAQKAPLVDTSGQGIVALCDKGLDALGAVSVIDVVRPARAALRAGWMARKTLLRAKAEPLCVLQGGLEPSEFERRAGLMAKTVFNRF